jgi:5-methylcytosine-specific restriction endonuclease McrA
MDARMRLLVWERDEGTCRICGGPGQEIDHIEAKKMGGRHGEAKKRIESIENLRLVCRKCHQARHG